MKFGFPWLGRRSTVPSQTETSPELRALRAEVSALGQRLRGLERWRTILEETLALEAGDRAEAALQRLEAGEAGVEAPPSPGEALSLEELHRQRRSLREQLGPLEADQALLEGLLRGLPRGIAWAEAGARIFGLCQRPFELSGFYLAQVDPNREIIRFPFFYEAGRVREVEPVPLSPDSGLTGWALFAKGPTYLDSLEACRAQGMLLTESEQQSGVCTKSWFGARIPVRKAGPPAGLMGFHSLVPEAFPPAKRNLMALVATLAAHRLAE